MRAAINQVLSVLLPPVGKNTNSGVGGQVFSPDMVRMFCVSEKYFENCQEYNKDGRKKQHQPPESFIGESPINDAHECVFFSLRYWKIWILANDDLFFDGKKTWFHKLM